MSQPTPILTTAEPEPQVYRVPLGDWSSLVEATKPGITRLVTVTSMVGFAMATLAKGAGTTPVYLGAVICLIGTALSASGANAINQFMERDRDARMQRTARRPLPSGRLSPGVALWGGVTLSILGVGVLTMVGLMPALVSLACVLSYVFLYTPLKPRSTMATFVGAIPGGLPPLIGWTVATKAQGLDSIREPLGLSLVVLMLVWQIPHFLAIAWMYRDDYAKGGYRVLPVIDTDGRVTAATMALWAAAMLPASLWPAYLAPELLGRTYLAIASITGAAYLVLALRLVASRERSRARAVFFASIIHLPVLLIAMVAEALIRHFTR